MVVQQAAFDLTAQLVGNIQAAEDIMMDIHLFILLSQTHSAR